MARSDSNTPRPPKHISLRWPGAGSAGVRKAIVTNRNKKMKVTLAALDELDAGGGHRHRGTNKQLVDTLVRQGKRK